MLGRVVVIDKGECCTVRGQPREVTPGTQSALPPVPVVASWTIRIRWITLVLLTATPPIMSSVLSNDGGSAVLQELSMRM